MALSLKDLKQKITKHPPRILIYGPEGLGKTTLAGEFPDPVFLQIEDGAPADMDLTGRTFGHLQNHDAVMDAVSALYNEDHKFKNVVVDTIDRLEPLVWAATCAANDWESIETPGYGKGYLAADHFWREFLEGLNALRRDREMGVILLAHSEIERFDDPRSASYNRFDYRLHKRAHAMIGDEMDAIFFVNQDASVEEEKQAFNQKRTRAKDTVQRWIYCERRPSMTAKNRFGMPDRLLFQKGKGYAKIAPYLKGTPPAAEAEEGETPQTAKAGNGNGKKKAA